MVDFNKLIQNLKHDLRSIPSTGECAMMDVASSSPQPHVTVATDPSVVDGVVTEKKKSSKDMRKVYLVMFVRHGMLSTEIFIFFLILLSVIRPSFLYRRIKSKEGNEMVQTRFSLLFLLIYSVTFTAIIHVLMYIQKVAVPIAVSC